MSYFQVIIKSISSGESAKQILVDASEKELIYKVIKPYKKGRNLFIDSTVIDSNDIKMIRIICTRQQNTVVRGNLNNEDLKRIAKLNRESDSMVIISSGAGYNPEDIFDAGEDVTTNFIKGPPGYGKSGPIQKFINNSWITAIGTGLIIAAVIAWRNWN